MYESMNGTGVSRLPKNQTPSQTPAPQTTASSLGRTVGTALVQAAAIVVVAKLVDVLVESFMSRRRTQQAQQPQRHPEHVHA